MKFLIVLLVVVVAGWLLLRGRRRDLPEARRAPPGALPQAMVQCRHCGVHLPRNEAIGEEGASYCSEAHRLAGPRSP
jgi:uncharacterized protein